MERDTARELAHPAMTDINLSADLYYTYSSVD
jgi:hypothetical protein